MTASRTRDERRRPPDGDVRRGFPLGPDWYTSVMGTGIVASAAATLPLRFPGLQVWATVVWALAAVWLVVLTTAYAAHWVRRTGQAVAHATDPATAPFWGAPAMGLMTVGLGALQFGPPILGPSTAVATSWTLWGAGTALGLVTTAGIPYRMITRREHGPDGASGAWLMPVVPPMVSASDGALLVEHVAPGDGRLTMLLACYAMFGVSLFATLAILPQIWNRLVVHGPGPAATVPTLWIVLGPLGQSVTAVNLLADRAPGTLPEPYAAGAAAAGLFYGVPTWGFAMIWIAIAASVTVRAVRARMPFALSWWSFTFPVGTCVTATSVLAARTHLAVAAWWATALYAALVVAWVVVAARTAARAAA